MVYIKTNLESIPACEADIKKYCRIVSQEINHLLVQYSISNAQGEQQSIFPAAIEKFLSFSALFQSIPLKSIFFNQPHRFIPQEVLQVWRTVISAAPTNIKCYVFEAFITALVQAGWDKALSRYFKAHHHFPVDEVLLLEDLQDFSMDVGVYRITFQRQSFTKEKIIIFLKQAEPHEIYNTCVYFHLQKALLSTASDVHLPYPLSIPKQKDILLLPSVPGISSDIALSLWVQQYNQVKSPEKEVFQTALEIILEAFMQHAALGDVLGRNDRHLMNALMAFTVKGGVPVNTLEDFNDPQKFLAMVEAVCAQKMAAIALIDIDLKWLLGKKNTDWILADIDFGLSELNLLSLLVEFGVDDQALNHFFEKRREKIAHYLTVYRQAQKNILQHKSLLFSCIEDRYPAQIAKEKRQWLHDRMNYFETDPQAVLELFKRYLWHYRLRCVYKATLIKLYQMALKSKQSKLLDALKEKDLVKYIPLESTAVAENASVSIQLQCFRGVLSKNDQKILSQSHKTTWEIVTADIGSIAQTFSTPLCDALTRKITCIEKDTAALLHGLN